MFRPAKFIRTSPVVLGLSCIVLGATPFARAAEPTQPRQEARVEAPASDERARGRVGTSNDFPGLEVHDWVTANTMGAQTRVTYRRMQSELDAGLRRLQAHFEHSPEYRGAVAEQKQTFAEYSAAKDKASASLASNSRYQEIVRLRDETGAQLAQRRADKHASKDEIAALAQLKLAYASDARAIEVQATQSDADLKNSRDKMVAASRKVVEMRASFDDSLHDNAEVAQLRKNMDDARVAMVTADALGFATALAADSALWYSSYIHRNDQGYYAAYGPAGTGYNSGGGYYSPYWGR